MENTLHGTTSINTQGRQTRMPRLSPLSRKVRASYNDQLILETRDAYKVEYNEKVVYFLPKKDLTNGKLLLNSHISFCEYKGMARHYHLVVDGKVAFNAAWQYPDAKGKYNVISKHVAIRSEILDSFQVK